MGVSDRGKVLLEIQGLRERHRHFLESQGLERLPTSRGLHGKHARRRHSERVGAGSLGQHETELVASRAQSDAIQVHPARLGSGLVELKRLIGDLEKRASARELHRNP
jgi:hypothetical protein